MKLFVILFFILTYGLIIFNRKYTNLFSITCTFLFLLIGAISPKDAVNSINFNVLGIFLGMMILSGLFLSSGVPSYLATYFVDISKTTRTAMLWVCLLSAFISSFVENVATILIVAPIAFEISKRLNISAVPLLIGASVSSNLQGCATMIGDSPSIIMAMSSGMDFIDFFWMNKRPGIFFAVQLGAVASFIVLYLLFRRYKKRVGSLERARILSWIPSIFMFALIVGLVLLSFLDHKPKYMIGYVCLTMGILAFLWSKVSGKLYFSLKKDVDWRTFVFLLSLFVIIGTLRNQGVMEDIARLILSISGKKAFIAFLLIVWLSVLLSAFVDNIPYTIAMIPVVQIVSAKIGVSQWPFLFGLLIGTCVGGNITPIGAACNVVGIGLLRKQGYSVGFWDFVRIGFPFTISAVAVSSLFIWAVYNI